ncbi:phosphatidylcholine and lysophosphatidylcholine phospholipase, partial [Elasticomyces elasticus]
MASRASSIIQSARPASLPVLSNKPENVLAAAGYTLYLMVKSIPGALIWLATFVTFVLPAWLYNVFSSSLTVTMNVTTILLIVFLVVSTITYFVRYRFLNVYTRLPLESQRKEPRIDFLPDVTDRDSKPGLSNYLDEFLSAIKVFGYLERPVFHELTRTMQTKKLIAGETLLLEEEKGFCLVVDGLVQIFVKSQREQTTINGEKLDLFDDESSYHEGNQGYQLLTEVKNGASMSSLFSILSLFTEDVNLRYDDPPSRPPSSHGIRRGQRSPELMRSVTNPSTPLREPFSPNVLASTEQNGTFGQVPHMTLDTAVDEAEDYFHPLRSYHRRQKSQQKRKSVHPDIVARAVVDTTIAVIPASAFRRLTRVYPKATAHIVQVILTRLQRVTLSTAHQYLGLTKEVLQIEKLMNKFTSNDLPNPLRGGALDRLRDKFAKEIERLGGEDFTKGIALHNPVTNRRRASSSMRKEVALTARMAASRKNSVMTDGSYDTEVAAGDLAGNVSSARHLARSGSLSFRNPCWTAGGTQTPTMLQEKTILRPVLENGGAMLRQDSTTEDGIFRESILDCMVKALGLDINAAELTRKSGAASVEQSPRLVSYDHKRQSAVFNNAFGFMDPYDASVGDDESQVSTSIASFSDHQAKSLHDELIDDVEIVYFPKGSILVEQGERNPGVYYVIDGFLDVSIPVDDKENKLGSEALEDRPVKPRLKRTKTGQKRASSVGGFSQEKRQVQKSLFLVKPGGVAGHVGTLSSYRSFTDVTAKTDVYVGFLPRASLERVAEKYPVLLLTMAKRLTNLLPRLILHIDFALEWVQ